MVAANPPLTSAFVAELASRLQGQGPALAVPADLARAAAGRARARRSSTCSSWRARARPPTRSRSATASAACASSARRTGATSSRAMSVVEQTLRDDPAGVYARDGLRHARPATATWSSASRGAAALAEDEVARSAIELARTRARAERAVRVARDGARRLLPDRRRPARRSSARSRMRAGRGRLRARRWRGALCRRYLRRDRRADRCGRDRWPFAAAPHRRCAVGRSVAVVRRYSLIVRRASWRSRSCNWVATLLVQPARSCRGWISRRASRPSTARSSRCRRC